MLGLGRKVKSAYKPTCGNCEYYGQDTMSDGKCHRFPPVVVPVRSSTVQMRPAVEHNTISCGEYVFREEA